MKAFLTRIFLFSLLLILTGQIGRIFLSPYYGNEPFHAKHEYYAVHRSEINTVFLGSSRISWQVSPRLFDSLLAAYDIKSFNLGAKGTFNPETYFLYEQILSEDCTNLKYAFVEIQPLDYIHLANINSAKNYYWHNWKYLKYSTSYLATSHYSMSQKIAVTAKYAYSFALNLIDPSRLNFLIKPKQPFPGLGAFQDGYFPMEDDPELAQRLADFRKDTSFLQVRIKNTSRSYQATSHKQHLNKAHLALLENLIRKSEEKGVTLFYIIPPKLTDYNELLALTEQLPSDHVIQVADSRKFPMLYRASTSSDIWHLNKTGSRLFTTIMAMRVDSILTSRQLGRPAP